MQHEQPGVVGPTDHAPRRAVPRSWPAVTAAAAGLLSILGILAQSADTVRGSVAEADQKFWSFVFLFTAGSSFGFAVGFYAARWQRRPAA